MNLRRFGLAVGHERRARATTPAWRIRCVAAMLLLATAEAGCSSGSETEHGSGGGNQAYVDGSSDSAPPEGGTEAALEAGYDDALDATEPQDAGCVPKTCTQLGYNCGKAPDACGGVIECGACEAGQTCGGTGSPNQCGANACPPRTCAQVNASCGMASDGCGDVIDCGQCAAPATCGGGGTPHQCGCAPRTCVQMGFTCGQAPDGCGGVVECGACEPGQTCGATEANHCGAGTCTPKSCAQLQVSCGVASDGCSATINCGACIPPEVCGGGGTYNSCGCLFKTCAQLGASCGSVDDGCGHTLQCGTCDDQNPCTGADWCQNGQCMPGAPVQCSTPPDPACYDAVGTCAPATGSCSYSPKPDGTVCGNCRECSGGSCVVVDDGTQCGNACRYCASGTCVARGDGYQYDATESHRCCGGDPVDITSNKSHCGGCGLQCATGRVCESVAATSGCSSHPAGTSGRCTCGGDSDCPSGIGSQQVCRTFEPYSGRCGPYSNGCASGGVAVVVPGCPDYCLYP